MEPQPCTDCESLKAQVAELTERVNNMNTALHMVSPYWDDGRISPARLYDLDASESQFAKFAQYTRDIDEVITVRCKPALLCGQVELAPLTGTLLEVIIMTAVAAIDAGISTGKLPEHGDGVMRYLFERLLPGPSGTHATLFRNIESLARHGARTQRAKALFAAMRDRLEAHWTSSILTNRLKLRPVDTAGKSPRTFGWHVYIDDEWNDITVQLNKLSAMLV